MSNQQTTVRAWQDWLRANGYGYSGRGTGLANAAALAQLIADALGIVSPDDERTAAYAECMATDFRRIAAGCTEMCKRRRKRKTRRAPK